ncbi:MAG: hypothetical protein LWW83_00195 [Azonexaceae bacterium]|nr:hypothetical protein [Azonexaceae bacterium]
MKQLTRLTLPLLLASLLAGNAIAGPGYHGEHRGYGPGPYYGPPSYQRHYAPPPHHHNRWIGPAAVLAIGGLALGAAIAASPPPPAPQVIYTAPPPPQPLGSWYFCRSSGQYYPYTQACPEGWVAVAPR